MGTICSFCGIFAHRPQYKHCVQNVFNGKTESLAKYVLKHPTYLSKTGEYLVKQVSRRIDTMKKIKKKGNKANEFEEILQHEIKHAMDAINTLIYSCFETQKNGSTPIDLINESFVMDIIIMMLDNRKKQFHLLGMDTLRKFLVHSKIKKTNIYDLTSVIQSILTFLEQSNDYRIKIESFKVLIVIFNYIGSNENATYQRFQLKFYTYFESIAHCILANIKPDIIKYQKHSNYPLKQFHGIGYYFDSSLELQIKDSTITIDNRAHIMKEPRTALIKQSGDEDLSANEPSKSRRSNVMSKQATEPIFGANATHKDESKHANTHEIVIELQPMQRNNADCPTKTPTSMDQKNTAGGKVYHRSQSMRIFVSEEEECHIYSLKCYDQLCALISTHNFKCFMEPLCSIITQHSWFPTKFCAFLVFNIIHHGTNIQANHVVIELFNTVCQLHLFIIPVLLHQICV